MRTKEAKRARMCRSADYSLPEARDYSTLPSEILLDIFDYLKKSRSIINLTAVCKKFNEILKSRFENYGVKLLLNVNRIRDGETCPVIVRSYQCVEILGTAVDPLLLEPCLASSSETAFYLKLGFRKNNKCCLYQRTLIKILSLLPNLSSIELKNVKVVPNEFYYENILYNGLPEMHNLSTIRCDGVSDPIFKCFWNTSTIRHVNVTNMFGVVTVRYRRASRARCENFMNFLRVQKQLKELHTEIFDLHSPAMNFPELEIFTINNFVSFATDIGCSAINNAPKLKTLRVTGFSLSGSAIHFIANSKNASLEKLFIPNVRTTAETLRNWSTNYPALKMSEYFNTTLRKLVRTNADFSETIL